MSADLARSSVATRAARRYRRSFASPGPTSPCAARRFGDGKDLVAGPSTIQPARRPSLVAVPRGRSRQRWIRVSATSAAPSRARSPAGQFELATRTLYLDGSATSARAASHLCAHCRSAPRRWRSTSDPHRRARAAATNRTSTPSWRGRVREDLYYGSTCQLNLPPSARRRRDIPRWSTLLASPPRLARVRVAPDALDRRVGHDWRATFASWRRRAAGDGDGRRA